MAEGKAAVPNSLTPLVIHKKGGTGKKKKRSKKRKTCLNTENSAEFPTFRHDKQTTSYLMFIFKKEPV
jgi:hypothetical protein